jgi:WD40 repeat protein/serine/threonine protein kinase
MNEREIFIGALQEECPADRQAYLDRTCGTDTVLRRRVEGLLRDYKRASSFLNAPALALVATVDELFEERPGTVIGPYKLLEQIGAGGFGIVFMALQQRPVRRKVALKVIKPGMDSKQIIARFEAERQALAMMDHQNIARVLDAGATDSGRPYFAMELVRGIPITQFCDDNRLTLRERLELFLAVCQAVQHAHQKGIIHRDLKPSNVLVTLHDGTPVVKVIDFGIAKALGQQRLTDKTLVTGFAQMIGTPLYMSPEQAEMSGLDADTRTDIYSLGVLLYELLTGATPFDKERLKEASYDEIRRIIREEEPAKPSTRISTLGQAATTVCAQRKSEPRRLSQLFRRELDWIVMKALEKDRNRRYETASSFAADVQRYLNDEPVEACPPSAWYRFRKLARRKKGVLTAAAAIGCVVLVAITGLAASTARVWRANQELRQNLYYQNIALADREWSANNLGRMEQLLEECPADLRGWEWDYLKQLRYKPLSPLHHESMVLCVAFSPTGACLASGSRDGVIKLWDVRTGQALRIFRADKERALPIFAATTVSLMASPLCHGPLVTALAGIPGKADTMVLSVAFSPDGQRLAAGCSDGSVKMWDLHAGTELTEWKAHPGPVACVAFSPNGQRLASSRLDYGWEGQPTGGEAKVWDAATGQEICTLERHTNSVDSVAFSPDGTRLLSGSADRTVKIWEARTGRCLFTCNGHTTGVRAVTFSPDGRSVASASGQWSKLANGEIKLWDAQTGEQRLTLLGHIGFVLSVTFSPDGQRLASAGMDKTIKLWDLVTGRETLTLRNHEDLIRAVAFSPDGHRLASASEDRTVRIWDATPLGNKIGEEPLTLKVNATGILGVAFHPDGHRLATVGAGAAKLWDSHTGQVLWTFPESEDCWCLSFSPDGQRLAAGAGETNAQTNEVRIWDIRTSARLPSLGGFRNAVKGLAFGPDSRHLVSAHWDRTVRRWDTAIGQEVSRIRDAHGYAISGLALSPDGKSAVTCSVDDTVKVWDLATGRHVITLLPAHPGRPTCVAFRPHGYLLASASADGTIKFWDTRTWKPQHPDLRDATGGVECLAFSPDGRLLAWGSTDAKVKIWDAATQEVASLRGHTSWVEGVAFSPDGKWLASASLDGTVKLWLVASVPRPARSE